MAWTAHPDCPRHLVATLEKAVNALPVEWLDPPVTGEVFESFQECERRLRGFALSQGFDIVQKGGSGAHTPGKRWVCIHHGVRSQNNRGLEPRVERNKQGEITSTRKRNTTAGQLACLWAVRCSYKDAIGRGTDTKAFILSVKELSHEHDLVANPFLYQAHQAATPEY